MIYSEKDTKHILVREILKRGFEEFELLGRDKGRNTSIYDDWRYLDEHNEIHLGFNIKEAIGLIRNGQIEKNIEKQEKINNLFK